jgi:hypothetical protein
MLRREHWQDVYTEEEQFEDMLRSQSSANQKKSLTRNQLCWQLDLELPASTTVEKLLFSQLGQSPRLQFSVTKPQEN